jgi:hypothetical protein
MYTVAFPARSSTAARARVEVNVIERLNLLHGDTRVGAAVCGDQLGHRARAVSLNIAGG